MKITDMDIANAQIEYGGEGTSNIEITKNILNEWRTSKVIADMKEAQAYSLVQNTAIEEKNRNYEDADGRIVTNKYASNVKTKTAQYRKSLLQKLDFTFAKPFLVSCEDTKYKEEWDKFLDDKVRAVIRKTAKEGINKGIGWSYPWIDEEGKLDLVSIDSITGYPAWSDEAHTELDAFVRDYEVTKYTNQTPEKIYKVEYWDKEIVEKYIDYGRKNSSGGALMPVGGTDQEMLRGLMYDTGEEELREGEDKIEVKQTHMKNKEGAGVSWNRVPFIFLKGNEDELPLLNECKEDIDTYDLTKSKGIDSILDDIDAVLVVEGIGAEMGELTRARDLVKKSRIMAIDIGGSAHFEKVSADITAIAQQLEIIKKDIQDNTSTVDMTTIALGSNPSGAAMKTFYEPLNIWANGFEEQFRVYMKNLKYFFDLWLSWKGFGTFEKLQDIEITFTLDRDMLIDEASIIQNINTSGELLSTETKLEMHPYVDDVEKEMKRLEEDKEKQMQEQKENIELMNFGNTINNNNKLMNEKKQGMPKKEEKPEKQAKI